jgi:hypothetical protein
MPTIAFLFDNSTTEYGELFEVYRVIIREVLKHERAIYFQLRGGGILFTRISSRISAVGSSTRGKYPSTSHTETDDKDLRATLTVRFATSAASKYHSIDADRMAMTLMSVPVESVTVSELPIRSARRVNKALEGIYSSYLGCFEVDRGDPLMLTLAANGLIPFCIYDKGILNWVVPFDHSPEDEVEISWTEGLGLDGVRFITETPGYLANEPLSAGGQLSTKLLKSRARPKHAEEVLRALRDKLEAAKDGEEFSIKFGREEFSNPRVDVRKIRDYCLNEGHIKGKHKAVLFAQQLGITAANWYYLAEQLAAGIEEKLVNRPEQTVWALQYEVKIPVTGPNGVTRMVTSGWKIEEGQSPFLTSAYIEDGARTEELGILAHLMVLDSDGVAFFERLFETAHAHALKTSKEWTPTPMWIVGYDAPIAEGEIGSAWVVLPDGKSAFSRWLRANNLCSVFSKSRRISARTASQSVEKERRYCEAFSQVLRLNGVECKVDWRLD